MRPGLLLREACRLQSRATSRRQFRPLSARRCRGAALCAGTLGNIIKPRGTKVKEASARAGAPMRGHYDIQACAHQEAMSYQGRAIGAEPMTCRMPLPKRLITAGARIRIESRLFAVHGDTRFSVPLRRPHFIYFLTMP